ncbi:MAG: hypothetical protein Q9168_006287 [Polycauliona sp. 1 TL-2023]
MHFSTTYLALAVSLVSTANARPQQNQYNQQATTTFDDGQYQRSEPTPTRGGGEYAQESSGADAMPTQCSMFKPYVAPGLLKAVCSLHMTPLAAGEKPTFPTSCFAGGAEPMSTMTLPNNLYNNEKQYQPQVTPSKQNNEYQPQATPSSQNNEYQPNQPQATPTQQGNGGYKVEKNTRQPSNTFDYEVPEATPTSGGGYGNDE